MNLYRILFLFLLSISIFKSQAQQNWLWSSGGNGNDEAFANTVDGIGNIYTTGYFSLSAKFDATVLTSAGSGDVFVSKQDNSGNYVWTVKAGGVASDRGYGISTDIWGNIFVTGFYSGTAVFGNDTLHSLNNSLDVFVTKLNSRGQFIWTKSFGGNDIDLGLDLHVDQGGNAVVTGQFRGQAYFGTFNFTSFNDTAGNPSYDIFILKLDSSGNVLWARQAGGKFDDRGLAVATDSSCNIYITGQFSDTLTLGNVYPCRGYSLGFLAKLDSSGNVIWMHTLLASRVIAYSVCCRNNKVYISGDFTGQLTISAKVPKYLNSQYIYKIFIACLDSSGAILWASTDGSDNTLSAQGLTVDNKGNAYTIGTFTCTMTEYSSKYGSGIFNSIGYRDVFVSKYNASTGVRLYERQYGGPRDEFASAICITNEDYPVIAGSFETDFNVPDGGHFLRNTTNFDSSAYGPNQQNTYCGYQQYGQFISIYSDGNKDIFSACPMDTSRGPSGLFSQKLQRI